MAVQVGTTKDQGLYNKPSAAVHPGALAAGTLPQYNIIWRSEDRIQQSASVLYNHLIHINIGSYHTQQAFKAHW